MGAISGRRWLAASAALALALACVVPSCLTATSMQISVRSDLGCDEAKGTTFTVGAPELVETMAATVTTYDCKGDGHIGTLTVVPSNANDDMVAIRIVHGIKSAVETCVPPNYEGCIVARRSMRFVPHERLDVPFLIENACLGIPCAAGQTCVHGTCRDAYVDSSMCTGKCGDDFPDTPPSRDDPPSTIDGGPPPPGEAGPPPPVEAGPPPPVDDPRDARPPPSVVDGAGDG